MTPESDVLRAVQQFLTIKGIFHFRVNNVAIPTGNGSFRRFHGMRGVADLIALHAGRFIAIEVKSATGRLSPEQKTFAEEVVERGGIAMCVHSIEELEADLIEAKVLPSKMDV